MKIGIVPPHRPPWPWQWLGRPARNAWRRQDGRRGEWKPSSAKGNAEGGQDRERDVVAVANTHHLSFIIPAIPVQISSVLSSTPFTALANAMQSSYLEALAIRRRHHWQHQPLRHTLKPARPASSSRPPSLRRNCRGGFDEAGSASPGICGGKREGEDGEREPHLDSGSALAVCSLRLLLVAHTVHFEVGGTDSRSASWSACELLSLSGAEIMFTLKVINAMGDHH